MNTTERFQPAQITPTDEQTAIQTSTLPTILVQANAGAAKTTTLALRIAQALHTGLAPEGILVLTYTTAACDAMRAALLKIGVPTPTIGRIAVRTFDSFSSAMLLSVERAKVPFAGSPEDAAPHVQEAASQCDLHVDSGFVERFLAVSRKLKGTLAWDNEIWNGAHVDDDLADSLQVELELLQVFARYEALRYPVREGVDRPEFRGPFDATYDLARLLADPEPGTYLSEISAWPTRLALLLVDEMHDLNLAMFTIVRRLLDSTQARFCGVGDFDQVIHGTAGAERRFMDKDVDLGERHARVFPLTATHRFSRSLAFMAGSLAGKSYSSAAAHPTTVDCAFYPGKTEQACERLLLLKLSEWKTGNAGRMSGVAILLRHAWQSVAVENALLGAGFLYDLRDFKSYVMQPEVLLVRALLAVATNDYEQLASDETLDKLVRALVFFCGIQLGYELSEDETQRERLTSAIRHVVGEKSTLSSFMEFQVLNNASPKLARRMRAAIEIARAAQAGTPWFDAFLDALEIERWIREVFIERQRQDDALRYFDGLKQAARSAKSAKAFFESLGAHAARLDGASQHTRARAAASQKKGTLTIACAADVKGLEFEHVVMPFLEHGVFPATLSRDEVEERNLFYVGITRARSRLTLLASAEAPSEFVLATGIEAPREASR